MSEVGAVAGSVRSSAFLVGVEIGSAALGSVSTKAKHLPHPATLPATPRDRPKRTAHKSTKTQTGMVTAASFVIARKWERPTAHSQENE